VIYNPNKKVGGDKHSRLLYNTGVFTSVLD